MGSIGIVGSGIAGLHLGLYLQQRGIPATIYSDRSPDELRAARLPNTVARFARLRARERVLGVDHWLLPEVEVRSTELYIGGPMPLSFCGDIPQPWNWLDMRMYQAQLLEDFADRGGQVAVGKWQASDVHGLSDDHDLMVVASGRGSLTEMFPRLSELSPYTEPQRRLCAGLYYGVDIPQPARFRFTVSPGHGEIFHAPFHTFDGPVTSLLFEAIPGTGFEHVTQLRYEDDPAAFNAAVLKTLRLHAPHVYELVNPAEFGLTRPLDLLQGAVTPVVRRGYARLHNDRFALAIGDVHIVNDPVLGQGANAASHAAWLAGEAIAAAQRFDEEFCRALEGQIWDYARDVTEWTNAALLPPPPHQIEVFVAATQNKAIADELIANFDAPNRNWSIFKSPEGAAAFLHSHGWTSTASPFATA